VGGSATPSSDLDIAITRCFEQLAILGADELIVVVGYHKQNIIDHYGDAFEGIPITYTYQREQKGLAHGLLTAEDHIDEDFMLMLRDNIFQANLEDIVRRQREERADAAFLVEEVPREEASRYSVCDINKCGEVTDVVEKPEARGPTLESRYDRVSHSYPRDLPRLSPRPALQSRRVRDLRSDRPADPERTTGRRPVVGSLLWGNTHRASMWTAEHDEQDRPFETSPTSPQECRRGVRGPHAVFSDDIDELYVFGSTVQGDADGLASDVDLLFVLDDDVDRAAMAEELRDIALDVMIGYGPVVELHALSSATFTRYRREGNPFIRNGLSQGRPSV
jgi:predicted nucleotidyltransferase